MSRALNDVMVFPHAKAVAPRAINGTRVLVAALILLTAIAAVVGVVVTAANGQTDAAIIIGIISAAFLSRVLC